jgi:hypothetical protein
MKFKTSRADMKNILCAFSTNSLICSFTKTFAYSIENENNAMSLFEICTGMIAKNKDCLLNLLFVSYTRNYVQYTLKDHPNITLVSKMDYSLEFELLGK